MINIESYPNDNPEILNALINEINNFNTLKDQTSYVENEGKIKELSSDIIKLASLDKNEVDQNTNNPQNKIPVLFTPIIQYTGSEYGEEYKPARKTEINKFRANLPA